MKMIVQKLLLRFILNSHAEPSIEAEITLQDGSWGRGSAPAAILPGRREKRQSDKKSRENLRQLEESLGDQLHGLPLDQEILDSLLKNSESIIGSDVSISLSLAFARAAAMSEKLPLSEYLCRQMNPYRKPTMKIPSLLVPILSGGVHSKKEPDSFQQIMICLRSDSMWETCEAARKINHVAREELEKKGVFAGIGASGGYLVKDLTTFEKIELAQDIMEKAAKKQALGLAIDVAGEHLVWDSIYHLDGNEVEKDDFFQMIGNCLQKFPIIYLEDPFDTGDIHLWRQLKDCPIGKTAVIGDDIFATQTEHIDGSLASGAVVKMNQVGTLTSTLQTVCTLKAKKMMSCVSHRSYETEDTALCDLAVAAAADFIKIGGVARGERIIKYNQLLRLESMI